MRKLTLTKVKADCLLFKQMKLSIEEKERNLRSFIDSQLDFKTWADMSDLEAVIVGSSNVEEQSNVEDEDADQQANQDDVYSMWPPNEERFIIGSFTDGIFPGEVIEDIGDTVRADFLGPATVLKMEKGKSLWQRPSSDQREHHILHRNSVLPIYPVMTINHYSTHRVELHINF